MQTRAQRKRARPASDNANSEDPAISSPSITRSISCPKPAPAQPRLLKKRRILKAFFNDMPPDIVHATIGHLPPQDLLSLSQTNRWFRDLLMRRSARHIWLRSFETIGLPPSPYPEECAEPAVADSLFGKNKCQDCSVSRAHYRIKFTLPFVRLCTACARRSVCPSDSRKVHRASMPLAQRKDLLELVPSIPYQHEKPHFYLPYLERLNAEYAAIEHDEAALGEWLARRKLLVKQSKEYGEACQKWQHEYTRPARERFLDRLKQTMKHVEAVDPELEVEFWQLGSTEQIAFAEASGWRRQPITEKRWDAIKDPTLRFLRDHREERLAAPQAHSSGPIDRIWASRNCTAA
ncbi:hypothetical protein HDZ31DRAFT_59608 [Schizophyllum fasciatum]